MPLRLFNDDDLIITKSRDFFLGEVAFNPCYNGLSQSDLNKILNFAERVTRVISTDGDRIYCSGLPTHLFLTTSMVEGLWDGVTIPNNNTPIRSTANLRCERCGTRFEDENYDTEAENGYILCPRCRERLCVLPYHRYTPKIEFYNTEDEDPENSLYMGVELEVDEGGESDRMVGEIMPIMNDEGKFFIYCSHDGSLEEGFEIITQPATIDYHCSIEDKYRKMFSTLISNGYQSHNTSTCGIHIHFNRNYYADNENLYITRLLYLLEKFWDEIVIFSRRAPRRLERYSKKVDCSSRTYINRYNKSGNHEGHYYALNITNENTIEFRVFRGTLNIESFMAILDFVNTIVRKAKECSTRTLQKITFEDLMGDRAREYYASRLKAREYEE